ncbi:MAG: hypothetical protein PWP56_2387 [Acetobacterium sp.]|jgi:hypothetical protein|nr:hypothetical protein [Acetobacterium sp.]
MDKALIDITFNVESDANGRDPDNYSETLRTYQNIFGVKIYQMV